MGLCPECGKQYDTVRMPNPVRPPWLGWILFLAPTLLLAGFGLTLLMLWPRSHPLDPRTFAFILLPVFVLCWAACPRICMRLADWDYSTQMQLSIEVGRAEPDEGTRRSVRTGLRIGSFMFLFIAMLLLLALTQ